MKVLNHHLGMSRIITAVCLLALFSICTTASAGEYPKTFTAWKGSTPTLDGYISPGEWDDAESQTGVASWAGNNGSTIADDELSLKHWMKHDGENLYIAFDVNDSVIYGFDTERYEPDSTKVNFPPVHQLTQDGRPWYGDGIEFMVHAANTWGDKDTRPGDGSSWQMVCSSHKSRLYGLDAGGLLEGEPRSSDTAWNNYQQWILDGDMVATIRVKSHEEGRGYVIEWMVKPDPCLEQTPGNFWDPANGVAEMGLTYELNDLDTFEEGSDHRLNFRHVLRWASTGPLHKNYGTLRLEPGPNPALAVAEATPASFTLDQNHPNPFNPTTTISFTVENSGPASLNVYSVTGQHVKTLLEGTVSPGNHDVIWNGTDSQGVKVSPGLYLYHLNTGGASMTRKMLLIK